MEGKLPRRARESHKGDYGRVCVLGGAVGYSGAPVLAARAAVRCGSGLVTVLVPEPVWPVAAMKLDCAMPWPLPAIPWNDLGPGRGTLSRLALDRALEKLDGADAALVGPGLSRAADAAWVARKVTAAFPGPLVLDADGINALEGHIDVLDERRDRLTVLTPHMGEFARLLGRPPGEDRAAEAVAFARRHGCVLVLKGHRTVVAGPDGGCYVNQTGNPGMATGGTGDVLAGMVLSLLGQGFDGPSAARWAVFLHGYAGDLAAKALGEYALAASDLLTYLPRALRAFTEDSQTEGEKEME